MQSPLLYTFRRCPYAIRARLAIAYSGVEVKQQEVLLRNKPKEMLDLSPKGTVPVLLLPDGTVIDESKDVMLWALKQADRASYYYGLEENEQRLINELIEANDNGFKPILDKYKYAVRHPEKTETEYREMAESWLKYLNSLLTDQAYLVNNQITMADLALFPFIRQFAFVNIKWFDNSEYTQLKKWFREFMDSELFQGVMVKL